MAAQYQNLDAVSEYNKKVLIGVGTTLTALPILVVALRFYTRKHYRIGYGLDDWTILGALVLCIAAGIVEILAAAIGGMGEHQPLGPNGELIHTSTLYNYEKCRYANEIITTINLGLVKVSILLFYRRLFEIRVFKIASMSMMIFVTVWTVAFTSVMAAQCVPASDFWNKFEIDYMSTCINVQKFYEALAWSDLALDVLVLALPIPMVCFLQMPWRKKIAVIDILMLGVVVLGSGIARLVSFLQVINETRGNFIGYYHDTLWWTAGPLFWLFAENSVAVIGACLPTLAPLWTRRRSLLGASSTSRLVKGVGSKSEIDHYNRDDSPHTGGMTEVTSLQKLVGPSPSTHVSAERVSSEERPKEGIHVDTTFSVARAMV